MAAQSDLKRVGSEPVATADVALTHAVRLLDRDPDLALRQADEVVRAYPGHPQARVIQGAAHRRAGRLETALAILEPLAQEQPAAARVHLELAAARSPAGRVDDAIASLRHALGIAPDSPDAWLLLADQFDLRGEAAEADAARARAVKAATRDPRLRAAADALVANDLPRAEALLREHLGAHPTDVAAMRMLAEVAARLRRFADAESLLARCLELAPSFDAARHNRAALLNRQGRAAEALPEVERLLARDPRNPSYRNLCAAIHANLGDFERTIAIYGEVLAEFPRQPKIWASYGHALKTAGRVEDSVAAYRRAIALAPTFGEAYWSLANLKTFRFAEADVAAMRAVLARADLADEDRLHVEFALGKALEDAGSFTDAFAHFSAGNALRKRLQPYRAADTSRFVARSIAVQDRAFFESRRGWGADAADPIFIVGLPRSGSTLVEQILASHPLVEGTMELPDLPRLAQELVPAPAADAAEGFAQALAGLTQAQACALGERYLASTRAQRRTDAPFFVDKMPNNWFYVGLIQLALPNAKIIDARRHPLDCGTSLFTQHFARGQRFAYGLEDIGRYYRDYVEWMAHVDAALPGRVHRLIYERMITDTEREVRRLLEFCGLPFETACLRFHENARPVRTASSEQVRRPINRDGVDRWRRYEFGLEPLRAALGAVLERYPDAPPTAGPENSIRPACT